MQILGLLGMYFDAVVIEVKTFFSDWLWPYCDGGISDSLYGLDESAYLTSTRNFKPTKYFYSDSR